MARIHIDKIEAIGEKGTSTIEFGKNLTLIMGKSETGKTTIYKCIDYLFGAKKDDKHRPFLKSTGYDTVVGYFTTDIGKIKITRKIDDNKMYVSIDDFSLSNEYTAITTSDKWIGILWKRILGLPDDFKVPSSKDGKMKSFSWKSINQAFMIYEKRVTTEKSIIVARDATNETAFFSEMLYLLYKEDLTEFDAEDGAKLRKIRRLAVQKYINSKRQEIENKIKNLEAKKPQGKDLETIISELKEKLEEINKTLHITVLENQSITQKLIELNKKIQNLETVIERYNVLESQYKSDIKRIGLIIDGEKTFNNLPKKAKCPFCDNPIETHNHTSYIQASKGELNQIVKNLNELNEAKQDIIEELNENKDKKEILLKQQQEKNSSINNNLLPLQTSLESQIKDYQEIIEYNKTIKFYEEMDDDFNIDFQANEKVDDKVEYKPKEIFEKHTDFVTSIEKYYMEILSEINFSPIDEVIFDLSTFDVKVNDNPKPNRSKGFQGLLNTVLVLAFRKYVNAVAKINPHFYLIDSPIQTLMTESNDENIKDDLRKGLFKYLFKNYGDDQIIIIENTDNHELPDFGSYNHDDVKIYEFTQDKEKGRYGFLYGVYQN